MKAIFGWDMALGQMGQKNDPSQRVFRDKRISLYTLPVPERAGFLKNDLEHRMMDDHHTTPSSSYHLMTTAASREVEHAYLDMGIRRLLANTTEGDHDCAYVVLNDLLNVSTGALRDQLQRAQNALKAGRRRECADLMQEIRL
jgi:hypothetical protein